MAELGRHVGDRRAFGEEMGRVGVPEVVQPGPREARGPEDRAEARCGVPLVQRRPGLGREDPRGRILPPHQGVGLEIRLPLAERLHEPGREVDAPRAFAGSQLQVQIYVNRRTDELSAETLDACPDLRRREASLTWVCPLEIKGFLECQDQGFLHALGLSRFARRLAHFWPRGGPVWDALAIAHLPHGTGAVLVEAKSHVQELYGPGCRASSTESNEKILRAFLATKRWLGAPDAADWLGPLYQSANRLAHLYFLRQIAAIEAWLVSLYVLDDPHSPTDLRTWQRILPTIRDQLGVEPARVPFVGEAFLKARAREELLKPRGVSGPWKRQPKAASGSVATEPPAGRAP